MLISVQRVQSARHMPIVSMNAMAFDVNVTKVSSNVMEFVFKNVTSTSVRLAMLIVMSTRCALT